MPKKTKNISKRAKNIPATYAAEGSLRAKLPHWSRDRASVQAMSHMMRDEHDGGEIVDRFTSNVGNFSVFMFRGYPVARSTERHPEWRLADKGEPGRRLYDAFIRRAHKRFDEELARRFRST